MKASYNQTFGDADLGAVGAALSTASPESAASAFNPLAGVTTNPFSAIRGVLGGAGQLAGELNMSSALQQAAVNEAVKLQKLVQISCGVVYRDDGKHIELDCLPRVKLVKEIIEEVGGKVIIFVPLTGTVNMLERILSERWSVVVVNGSVSTNKRNQIFHNFQNTDDPHVLIAHPATMAHGLTLTSASTIIWYGPVTSNEQYVDANGRIERIWKKHVSNIINIEATDLEHKMFERLRSKQKLQGLLLDLIKEETNG